MARFPKGQSSAAASAHAAMMRAIKAGGRSGCSFVAIGMIVSGLTAAGSLLI